MRCIRPYATPPTQLLHVLTLQFALQVGPAHHEWHLQIFPALYLLQSDAAAKGDAADQSSERLIA